MNKLFFHNNYENISSLFSNVIFFRLVHVILVNSFVVSIYFFNFLAHVVAKDPMIHPAKEDIIRWEATLPESKRLKILKVLESPLPPSPLDKIIAFLSVNASTLLS